MKTTKLKFVSLAIATTVCMSAVAQVNTNLSSTTKAAVSTTASTNAVKSVAKTTTAATSS